MKPIIHSIFLSHGSGLFFLKDEYYSPALCLEEARRFLGRDVEKNEKFVFEYSTQPFKGAVQRFLRFEKGLCTFWFVSRKEAEEMKSFDSSRSMGMSCLFDQKACELFPNANGIKRVYVKLSPQTIKTAKFVRKASGYDFNTLKGEWALCDEAVTRFSSLPHDVLEVTISVSDRPFENSKSVTLYHEKRYGENEIEWNDPQGWSNRCLLLPMQDLIKSIRPDYENIKTLYFRFD